MTGPITAITQAFVQIFNFSGRATQSEFWWAYAAFFVVLMIAFAIDTRMVMVLIQEQGQGALFAFGIFDFYTTPVYLVTLIPILSLSVRHLHDAGFSGFWLFLSLLPIIGSLVLLVMYVMPSSNTACIYGSSKQTTPINANHAPVTLDAHQRAMQGYALLFDKDKQVSPQEQAARKAEISDYYRSRVLKPAAGV
jgi:uncharacterized membrane protein YhaH (DUF805 family)